MQHLVGFGLPFGDGDGNGNGDGDGDGDGDGNPDADADGATSWRGYRGSGRLFAGDEVRHYPRARGGPVAAGRGVR
jgi:hypothetical protein